MPVAVEGTLSWLWSPGCSTQAMWRHLAVLLCWACRCVQAGLDKEANASAFSQLDLTRCGVLVGSGMGGLSVFQDGGCRAAASGWLAGWLAGRVGGAGGSCTMPGAPPPPTHTPPAGRAALDAGGSAFCPGGGGGAERGR